MGRAGAVPLLLLALGGQGLSWMPPANAASVPYVQHFDGPNATGIEGPFAARRAVRLPSRPAASAATFFRLMLSVTAAAIVYLLISCYLAIYSARSTRQRMLARGNGPSTSQCDSIEGGDDDSAQNNNEDTAKESSTAYAGQAKNVGGSWLHGTGATSAAEASQTAQKSDASQNGSGTPGEGFRKSSASKSSKTRHPSTPATEEMAETPVSPGTTKDLSEGSGSDPKQGRKGFHALSSMLTSGRRIASRASKLFRRPASWGSESFPQGVQHAERDRGGRGERPAVRSLIETSESTLIWETQGGTAGDGVSGQHILRHGGDHKMISGGGRDRKDDLAHIRPGGAPGSSGAHEDAPTYVDASDLTDDPSELEKGQAEEGDAGENSSDGPQDLGHYTTSTSESSSEENMNYPQGEGPGGPEAGSLEDALPATRATGESHMHETPGSSGLTKDLNEQTKPQVKKYIDTPQAQEFIRKYFDIQDARLRDISDTARAAHPHDTVSPKISLNFLKRIPSFRTGIKEYGEVSHKPKRSMSLDFRKRFHSSGAEVKGNDPVSPQPGRSAMTSDYRKRPASVGAAVEENDQVFSQSDKSKVNVDFGKRPSSRGSDEGENDGLHSQLDKSKMAEDSRERPPNIGAGVTENDDVFSQSSLPSTSPPGTSSIVPTEDNESPSDNTSDSRDRRRSERHLGNKTEDGGNDEGAGLHGTTGPSTGGARAQVIPKGQHLRPKGTRLSFRRFSCISCGTADQDVWDYFASTQARRGTGQPTALPMPSDGTPGQHEVEGDGGRNLTDRTSSTPGQHPDSGGSVSTLYRNEDLSRAAGSVRCTPEYEEPNPQATSTHGAPGRQGGKRKDRTPSEPNYTGGHKDRPPPRRIRSDGDAGHSAAVHADRVHHSRDHNRGESGRKRRFDGATGNNACSVDARIHTSAFGHGSRDAQELQSRRSHSDATDDRHGDDGIEMPRYSGSQQHVSGEVLVETGAGRKYDTPLALPTFSDSTPGQHKVEGDGGRHSSFTDGRAPGRSSQAQRSRSQGADGRHGGRGPAGQITPQSHSLGASGEKRKKRRAPQPPVSGPKATMAQASMTPAPTRQALMPSAPAGQALKPPATMHKTSESATTSTQETTASVNKIRQLTFGRDEEARRLIQHGTKEAIPRTKGQSLMSDITSRDNFRPPLRPPPTLPPKPPSGCFARKHSETESKHSQSYEESCQSSLDIAVRVGPGPPSQPPPTLPIRPLTSRLAPELSRNKPRHIQSGDQRASRPSPSPFSGGLQNIIAKFESGSEEGKTLPHMFQQMRHSSSRGTWERGSDGKWRQSGAHGDGSHGAQH